LAAWLATLPEERFPNLTRVLREPATDSDRRFEFGLACLVDGLEARAGA